MIVPLVSLSRVPFTWLHQHLGTGMGTCLARGTAFSFRCMWAGGTSFIEGKGADLLNVLDANWERINCSSLPILSAVGAYGSVVGLLGGGVRCVVLRLSVLDKTGLSVSLCAWCMSD